MNEKNIQKQNNDNKPLFKFGFNLDKDHPQKTSDGSVMIFKDALEVTEHGNTVFEKPLSEIEELVTDNGVGCIFVSYRDKKDGSIILICRADMKFAKKIIKTVRRINSYIESVKLPASFEIKDDFCPICKRPYRPGSSICLHCTGKKLMIKRTINLFMPYKSFVIISVLLFFAISGISLVMPYINKIAVDNYIQSDAKNVSLVSFTLVMLSMLALELVLRALSVFRSHLLIIASNKMIVDLRSRLFNKVQKLSVSKISQKTAGDLMHRVTSDTASVENFLVNYLPSTIEQLVLFAAVGIFLFVYDPILCLLILLPTPFVVLSFNFFWKYMRGLFHKRWTAGSKTNSILHDIFSGIRVVKAFGMEHKESKRFEDSTEQEKYLQQKTDCIWSVLMPVLQFFVGFGEFIILFYVGNRILGGKMTLGEMTQFSAYASMIYGPLRMIAHIPRHIMRFATSLSKIYEILDESEDVKDSENPVSPQIKGYIDINDVSFGYDSGKEVLHKINIHIKPGEFIGIVGASGVGKSTLINLIMRMYDVEEGQILVDNVDIRNISQKSLRSQMGVVLQETFLFSGSVYQNIAYAKQGATYEEVIAVSKLAGCHEFITKMPDGYNSRVGEKGMTLSGGERQRIAIARALLHDPKILILDEATASLDTKTEKQIQDALATLSENRTTIAIAHRLSTLRNATRLVVLDKGRVAEVGTHAELMQKEGIYYGLVMAQRELSSIGE